MDDGRSLLVQIAKTKGYIKENAALSGHVDVFILLKAFGE